MSVDLLAFYKYVLQFLVDIFENIETFHWASYKKVYNLRIIMVGIVYTYSKIRRDIKYNSGIESSYTNTTMVIISHTFTSSTVS